MEDGVLYFIGTDGARVLLAHKPDDGTTPQPEKSEAWDRVLLLSPAAAAGLGASLVAHAVELDAASATEAVARVLADVSLF